MAGRLSLLLTLLGLSAVCDGEVRYVRCEPSDAIQTAHFEAKVNISAEANWGPFPRPAKASGTTSPRAAIATASSDTFKIAVAIDTRDPNSATPDVARLDFTNRGEFDDKNVLPLSIQSGGTSYGVTPSGRTFTLARGDKAISVTVKLDFWESERPTGPRWLRLEVAAAMEDDVQFGDKTYKVRLIDTSGEFTFDHDGRPRGDPNTSENRPYIDTVAIDFGAKASQNDVRKNLLGQPFRVDGKWYLVHLSKDGKGIVAEAVDIPTSRITVKHSEWSAKFTGPHIFWLTSGQKEYEVPAGEYEVEFNVVYTSRKKDHAKYVISGKTEYHEVAFPADELTELKIGPPLTARVCAEFEDDAVALSVQITDSGGTRVNLKRPDFSEPLSSVIIVNSAGKVVHKASLEISCCGSGFPAWQPPKNLRGIFRAKLDAKDVDAKLSIVDATFRLPPEKKDIKKNLEFGQQESDDADKLTKKVDALADDGEIQKAYEDFLKKHPDNRLALRDYANFMIWHGRPQEGGDLLARIQRPCPQGCGVVDMDALRCRIQGDKEGEIKNLKVLLKEEYANNRIWRAQAMTTKARIAMLQGDTQTAQTILTENIELAPMAQKADARFALGDFYIQCGDSNQAIAAYGSGIDLCRRLNRAPADLAEQLMPYSAAMWANGKLDAAVATAIEMGTKIPVETSVYAEVPVRAALTTHFLGPRVRLNAQDLEKTRSLWANMVKKCSTAQPISLEATVRVLAGSLPLDKQVQRLKEILKAAPYLEWSQWAALFLGLEHPLEAGELLDLLPKDTVQGRIAQAERKANSVK